MFVRSSAAYFKTNDPKEFKLGISPGNDLGIEEVWIRVERSKVKATGSIRINYYCPQHDSKMKKTPNLVAYRT